MAVHVINEANRCLNCKKPMCMQGCPIHTTIPMMIKAFKEGNLNEAGEMLFENNPMSMICSLVCNHENQCEGHCVLGRKGEPVHISSIENYVSDTYFDKMQIPCQPKNGKKVAVIGAGPAGITIAILLAKKGYGVTIFDSRDKIGGVLPVSYTHLLRCVFLYRNRRSGMDCNQGVKGLQSEKTGSIKRSELYNILPLY